MTASSSNSRAALTQDILGYLSAHPGSEDTLEGIVEWWLLQHYVTKTRAAVRAVLSQLVRRGFVLERSHADGRSTYRLNPRQRTAALRLSQGN